jgi:hypothetical protein
VIDAAEVSAALESALQLAEAWAADGTGNLEDRLRVHTLIRDWQKRGGRLSEIASSSEAAIIGDLDEPLEVDGQWWRTKRKASRKGWDKEGLRIAINSQAFADRIDVDESTGEILASRPATAREVAETIWQATDVATGRTKVLRTEFGLDLDEYAETEWSTILEPCELSEINPDIVSSEGKTNHG